ncbi:molecular chaperone [Hafnia alvei]|uniref:Molecular chaperone n=1 Tax=Hafnia alvei TaxID=569 RepID=A0ABD7Q898_HAFAL|nr:molecular chaperone [Hafnia alvei]MBI0274285.1 molecular chaperone [Hafnia alvei]PNK99662.1 molecular chaperone [Hafnia alvei]TBL69629.1 molecular chaperone [Hafnia alvei]STQ70396.1 Chaperone protein fimC precursor [Hafnia alvei]
MKFNTKVVVPMLIGLLIAASGAQAAVRPALTRIVALESDKETPIKLINDDKTHDYLVQSWIEDQQGNDKGLPLILTPPLFKISAGREGRLRMVILPGKIPQDRESVYWLWIQEIPPVSKSKENQLQLAVRTRLKVFVRPTDLKEKSADTLKALTWQVSHEDGKAWLVAKNPTEYYASFSELSVSSAGKQLPLTGKNTMVPAKGEARYALPAGVAGSSQLNYSLINDFGGDTPILHQTLTF